MRAKSVPPPSDEDAGFLAGFIEAEGSLAISPANGAQNWRCSFGLWQRDDDSALLIDLQEKTGLGSLSPIGAQGNSHPQTVWSIDSRAECLRLVEIIERHPLCGRKRLEFEVWAEALRTIECNEEPQAQVIPPVAAEIRELRRYVNPPRVRSAQLPSDDNEFAAYLGGFLTGEGHFYLQPSQCGLIVKLRDDDRALLDAFVSRTGLGRIYAHPARGTSNPAAAWGVFRRDELQDVVRLLDGRLRGRKLREFLVWREAAVEFSAASTERRRLDTATVERTRERLASARTYVPPTEPLPPSSSSGYFVEISLGALRASAAEVDGPLTATAYMRVRRSNPHWPDRNTIVRAYGSWAIALALAGLDDRISWRARAHRTQPPRRSSADPARDTADRERVLEAVRTCARGLGHEPTVHEYFAWRAARRPDLPALRKTYRLFPGGWASVRDLAAGRESLASS
jgi:hypothetical protein